MVFDRFSDLVSFLKPHASYFQDVRPIGTAAPSPSYPKAAGGHNQTGEVELDAARPPYTHAMLAGGLGGTSGDLFMHSLDTVKTRQQGDPRTPPRYRSLGNTYYTIWRLEGIRRGLYSGLAPALAGSFSGTVVFFGTYEYFKRQFIDSGYNPSLSYLAAGFLADAAAAPVYVPSEVLKTRLQLQGRYNNPHFQSGYNYKSTANAIRTIVRTEGVLALFYGFKATLYRDLPYSALQFAFYEQERKMAKDWCGSERIGLPLEILTGASAGGLAGILTCPLDVVKTRIQTQVNVTDIGGAAKVLDRVSSDGSSSARRGETKRLHTSASSGHADSSASISIPKRQRHETAPNRHITSMLGGLRILYKSEGVTGLFRGVGPRALWTSVQSGTMLVLYQYFLQVFGEAQLATGRSL